jgi:DNA-binding transcriptional LysR family regulator
LLEVFMLDGVSLDQLRTFIAVADEKSFSAAGRRLRRAQSVVSQTMANLEGQLGVKLFDRTARLPVLTHQGRALLSDARAVADDVDLLKARAKNLAGGLEPELSVAVDVMFPPAPLTAAVAAFQQEFPSTLLKFEVKSSAVVEPVFDGRCVLGLVSSCSRLPPNVAREPLLMVSAPTIVSRPSVLWTPSTVGRPPLAMIARADAGGQGRVAYLSRETVRWPAYRRKLSRIAGGDEASLNRSPVLASQSRGRGHDARTGPVSRSPFG